MDGSWPKRFGAREAQRAEPTARAALKIAHAAAVGTEYRFEMHPRAYVLDAYYQPVRVHW